MSEDPCKGCRTSIAKCYYRKYNKFTECDCPCINCLIKGVCDIACEEFKIVERKSNEKSRVEIWACKGKPL